MSEQNPPGEAPSEPPSNVIPFPSRRETGEQASLPGIPDADDGDNAPKQAAATDDRRRETVLMAELRGWAAISERIGVSQAEHALAETIDRALSALMERNALAVTLEGDSTQPAVSCTFDDPDSPVDALRAAVDLRRTIAEAQSPAPPEHQFRVGMGLDAGPVATVTNDEGISFESIGPIRMFAAKLRDFAGAGQIFMSAAVYLDVRDLAHVQSLGQVRVNAYGDTREAFSLTDIRAEGS